MGALGGRQKKGTYLLVGLDEVLTVDSSGLELHVEIASKIVESGYLARKIEILLERLLFGSDTANTQSADEQQADIGERLQVNWMRALIKSIRADEGG